MNDKALADHAKRTESEARIAAMIALAASEPGIPVRPAELDADPWLLNVQNGTLDLRTGTLRVHEGADLITKLAPVNYDPAAECPLWLAFLDRIMEGKASLIEFLQRSAGYSLTGDISEQVLFFFYGRGRNGKSTFLTTILTLLGDYGRQAAPGLLTMKRHDAHPTERADLMGARFVASIEVEQGRRLAEALVKELTGGDRQKARFMRGDFFEWEPTHKLYLAVNHRPVVTGTDLAIWRRIRLVPFSVRIPEEEQDRNLSAKLKGEASGILNWALEGCLAWQGDGLGAPLEVVEATASYRAEQDVLGAFIDDECTLAEDAKATAKSLYAAYREWSKAHGEEPATQTAFGLQLGERGLRASRGRSARWWRGIGLNAQPGLENGGLEREA
ncbi:hypothetical protein LCGC14_1977380 [marine sediment metagenome]|uniref:SF3 helicase domain-containing protein n=1 Tax=marine sediment metagenome TaxID=412755 RepID=A0A0F9I6Y0_9ZZZZ